jgi:hypothetical protein
MTLPLGLLAATMSICTVALITVPLMICNAIQYYRLKKQEDALKAAH